MLEGINLIKKTNKNVFSWCGKLDETIDNEAAYLKDLEEEKLQLANEEAKLDG